jgi:hypothetical protein
MGISSHLCIHVFYNALHEHVEERGQREVPGDDQEHPGIRPQHPKRFVNFMNNPDEETAIAHSATETSTSAFYTMVTMPGFFLVRQGLIEGFKKKTGWVPAGRTGREPKRGTTSPARKEYFPPRQEEISLRRCGEFPSLDCYNEHGRVNETCSPTRTERATRRLVVTTIPMKSLVMDQEFGAFAENPLR